MRFRLVTPQRRLPRPRVAGAVTRAAWTPPWQRQPQAPAVHLGRYRYTRWRWRLLFGMMDGLVGPVVRWSRRLRRSLQAPQSCPPEDPAATTTRHTPAADPKSILVAQLDHLGDAVLSTAIFPLLRQRFPEATIDVLASHWNEPILRTNPCVRRVHVSHRNWFSRDTSARPYLSEALQLGRQMARYGYDLGIDVRGDFLVALLLRAARIPRRLGWSASGGEFLLTDLAPWVPGRPEIDARRVLIERLGIVAPPSFRPTVCPTWRDRQHVRRMLAGVVRCQGRMVVVHCGAGTEAKRWPTVYFQQLVDRLANVYRPTVILVGAAADRARAAMIAGSTERGAVVDWTGRLTVLELAALLEWADLFIGNDSGPAHIAAAAGTTTLVLFSGTNQMEQWRPPGRHVHVVRHPVACSPCHQKSCPVAGHPCMTGLTPERVWAAVEELLDRDSIGQNEVFSHAACS